MEVSVVDILKNEGVKKTFSFFETIKDNDIEFYGEIIHITKPVRIEGYVINYEGKIRLYLTIETELERICARCLASYNEKIEFEADYVFARDPYKLEEDAYLLKGDIISLDDIVIKEIASQMTMKPLCKADCKGICPKCGRNKNTDKCDCVFDEVDPRLQILSSFLDEK